MRGTLAALLLLLFVPAAHAAVPLPPGPISVSREPCPRTDDIVFACVILETGVIHQPDPDVDALYHEIGHLYDHRVLTDVDRATFTRLVWRWYPYRRWSAHSERFAEAYSRCALERWPEPAHVAPRQYEYWVSRGAHRRVCRLIRSARADGP